MWNPMREEQSKPLRISSLHRREERTHAGVIRVEY